MSLATSLRFTGAKQFRRRLEAFARDLDREKSSLLKQEARAACVAFGAVTQPGGWKDPVKFRARIAGDIRRVFISRESTYALAQLIKPRSMRLYHGFLRATKAGNTAQANRYLRDAGIKIELADPAIHRAARTGPRGNVAAGHIPTTAVRAASINKYTRDRQQNVGTAKAGWYAAAQSLGGRVRRNITDAATGARRTEEIFPAWVRKLTRKFSGLGGSRVSSNRIEVFTNVTYAGEAMNILEWEQALALARSSFRAALTKALTALKEKHFRRAA